MNSSLEKEYVPGKHPDLPPPVKTTGLMAWAKQNLFSSPLNTVLTLLSVWFLWTIIPPFFEWAAFNSIWTAGNRQECWDQMSSPGAVHAGHSLKTVFLFSPMDFIQHTCSGE